MQEVLTEGSDDPTALEPFVQTKELVELDGEETPVNPSRHYLDPVFREVSLDSVVWSRSARREGLQQVGERTFMVDGRHVSPPLEVGQEHETLCRPSIYLRETWILWCTDKYNWCPEPTLFLHHFSDQRSKIPTPIPFTLSDLFDLN